MSRSICILGAFGYDTNQLDGQTVKTRNVYRLLQLNTKGRLYAIDTMHIRRKPLSAIKLLWALIKCRTLVIIPCLNNLTYIFPITYFLSKILNFGIIHICVGGWQVEYFQGNERFQAHPMQLRQSKKIKAFLPEMARVNDELTKELGFKNTEVFPNFRFIRSETRRVETTSETLRLVFLARVDKKKGYDTIFSFAEDVEMNGYRIVIDFYGPINEADEEEFMSLLEKHKRCVSYKGVLQQDEVTKHLENYDVMLLPTTIYTEGFPGSILDAYIAGIPVIVTEWKHCHEFVDDNETGFIIPFNDCQREFNDRIMSFYNDRIMLSNMKAKAFEKRLLYSDQTAWGILSKYL